VPLEYSIQWLNCTVADRLDTVMVGRAGAAQDRLRADLPDTRPGRRAVPTASFDAVFQAAGTRILVGAIQAPRMNAICERLVGTLRREVLDRTLIHGEAHLRAVLTEYQTHYNTARPHQGIAQHVPDADRDTPRATVTDPGTARIHRRPVLGGLINEYTHAA
jgi:putative transposase